MVRGVIVCATAMCIFFTARAELPNLLRNDQYPIFSSYYPYDFLTFRQKANLMRFDYTYVPARFRISASGYRQYARRARDSERNIINIGDIDGRWNMIALFYDPVMRATLLNALAIGVPDACGNTTPFPEQCATYIQNPVYSDPNKEFGFFTIPALYRKYGARFESEILLIDRCYYAVGLKAQWGLADVRQTVLRFGDLTCQALGMSCPANERGITTGSCPAPNPMPPTPITPPFTDPVTQPPCFAGAPDNNPDDVANCVEPIQPFEPACNESVNLQFPGSCKEFVIENIMTKKDTIAQVLGLDINNYHKVGLDDLRLLLYWRHIYIINEDDERYARSLFMPFAEVGVGIPMEKAKPNYKPFAVSIGNNNHTYVGGTAGFTIDFLDTIDLTFSGGFSYFFPHEYCGYRLPTSVFESGIFPYTADVNIRPGPTWYFNFGMHAWHFLDNVSIWAEYCIVSHAQDRIEICRSFIPPESCYFKTGFLVEEAECLTKWESHVGNVGINYDLSDNFQFGVFWQAPIKQRNVYRQGTILGTITFIY